ncbi:ribosomal-protein-alanine N-acetyltransferase [Acholeplasma morum]|uniref:ribosomal protein S18-alanine N-acetyltransferase n=1 Tax=Paracholeplasma morum TaxID=264637 RepID=UPI00195EE16F|nr:ribosomal protein S18-alanine N-acetyltransferase [Paracholeplasma morum]MBM7453153.1 ribosomal-protein-alanine N-acetyltransferase [Paracholeplasma morum]
MIRKMKEEDIFLITEAETELLGSTLGYEMIHNEIKHHDFAHYFVIEEDGIKGYVGLWINDDIGQIVNFLILKPYQNQGYGKQLMTFIMDYFKQFNVNVISLEVRESNESAIHLYESFGFVKSYRRVKYYENKEDAHVMIWRGEDENIGSRE